VGGLGCGWAKLNVVFRVGLCGWQTLPRPKKSLQVKGLNPINSLQLFFSPDIGLQI